MIDESTHLDIQNRIIKKGGGDMDNLVARIIKVRREEWRRRRRDYVNCYTSR